MLSAKFSTLLAILLLLACSKEEPPETEPTVSEQAQQENSETTEPKRTVLGIRRISPYDAIVKKHARRYGFDWRLISAQIYAESGFREGARSRTGALGLMQIMPSTAKHLGVHPPDILLRPEDNIALGCLYDRRLYSIWKDERGQDRLAFMFASYNAGPKRVVRAQRRATIKNTWAGIKYHLPGQTRHYVYKIFNKFEQYKKIAF